MYIFIIANQLIATSLYRKKCCEEVSGYDENMKKGFEDWEFGIAIIKKGWKYKIIPEFLFYYRKAKKSILIDTISNHDVSIEEYILRNINIVILLIFKFLYLLFFIGKMQLVWGEKN